MEIILGLFKNIGLVELLIFIGGIIFFIARLEGATRINKEIISSELSHVLKLMEVNHQNLKDDISRLEKKQEESNKIKERLATQEALVAEMQSILHDHLNESHRLSQHHDINIEHDQDQDQHNFYRYN